MVGRPACAGLDGLPALLPSMGSPPVRTPREAPCSHVPSEDVDEVEVDVLVAVEAGVVLLVVDVPAGAEVTLAVPPPIPDLTVVVRADLIASVAGSLAVELLAGAGGVALPPTSGSGCADLMWALTRFSA